MLKHLHKIPVVTRAVVAKNQGLPMTATGTNPCTQPRKISPNRLKLEASSLQVHLCKPFCP